MPEAPFPIDMELAGDVYHRAVQFAWELDARFGAALSPGEFTALANEHMYFMVFLLDYDLFYRAGPEMRGLTLDRLGAFLNELVRDEGLARLSKYQTKRQVEPRIRLTGFDHDTQNARTAAYGRFVDDELDFNAAIDEFTRWVLVSLTGRAPEPVYEVTRLRAESDFAWLQRRLNGVPDPETN